MFDPLLDGVPMCTENNQPEPQDPGIPDWVRDMNKSDVKEESKEESYTDACFS